MQNLANFLSALNQGLDQLQQDIQQRRLDRRAVRYDPRAAAPGHDAVLIGIGKFPMPPIMGISLNNKAAGRAVGTRFSSVTNLVLRAPAEVVSAWREIVGDGASPDRFFQRFTLVVEDASPDSCFGLLCLLMRLTGSVEEVPEEWVRYMDAWEQGEIVVGDSVFRAYGCLHNALVHEKIERDITGAWLDGLRLMLEALRSGASPVALPRSASAPIIAKASAFLTFEEQTYLESHSHAAHVQLALPMIGSNGSRRRLVDAYLAEQSLPFGSIKAFSRTDRTLPFFKNGFTVMALYRAIPKGEGDDFTVSVDPSAGVELVELWRELEHREDAAWKGQRPCDTPRTDLAEYPQGKRESGGNGPNQPWYHDYIYSLIAAPKKVNGDFGTKFSWRELREIVWQTYQPFRAIRVRAGSAAVELDRPPVEQNLRSLERCFPENFDDSLDELSFSRTRLFVAGWHRPDNTSPAFVVTPTLCRYLTACIEHAPSPTPLPWQLLPEEGYYSWLELPGGLAIVSPRGAFIVHDGSSLPFPVRELKDEFDRARRLLSRIESGGAEIAKLLDKADAYFSGKRRDLSEAALLHRLSAKQIEITRELHHLHAAVVSPGAKRFRDALLERWGIAGWLDSLARDVDQIKTVLHGKSDLDAAQHVASLHAWGIPAAVAIGLIEFAFDKSTFPLWHLLPEWYGINWSGLVLFVGLAFLVYAVMEWGLPVLCAWYKKAREMIAP